MFAHDDPLKPPSPVFDEPWQAQALALADSLVGGGHVTATDWAEALGAALRRAEADGAADTLETYYLAVISALEAVTEASVDISPETREARSKAWISAYRTTPHGEPVMLKTTGGADETV
ncbi:MAG: nitrile hydratase accessory protein [Pseudomonadota bacterium]